MAWIVSLLQVHMKKVLRKEQINRVVQWKRFRKVTVLHLMGKGEERRNRVSGRSFPGGGLLGSGSSLRLNAGNEASLKQGTFRKGGEPKKVWEPFSRGLCTGDPSASPWSHQARRSGAGGMGSIWKETCLFLLNSTDDSNAEQGLKRTSLRKLKPKCRK